MAKGAFTWFGKKVLVTGGDGFVASHLAMALIRLGANVVVTVRHLRPTSTIKLLDLEAAPPDIEYSDLSNYLRVQQLCNRHQIDTIFHLAASAIVSDASNAPMSTFENNIIPSLNILEAARINYIPRVIIASSDKSYGDHAEPGDPERIPYREDHALRGLDVYSASKVCADMMSQTYALQYKLRVLVVRSCNIYGPGDLNFTRLIPRTVLRLLQDRKPVIHEGNTDVKREYIYVDDLVNAYLLLAERVEDHYQQEMPRTGRSTYGWSSYNVGSYESRALLHPESCPNIRNVEQVINQIKQKLGKTQIETRIKSKNENFIEIPDQYLDSSKIRRLGFQTKTTFDAGLDATVEWYQRHLQQLRKLGDKYLEDS